MPPTSAATALLSPAAPDTPLPWTRVARLLTAAALVGAILGGMG